MENNETVSMSQERYDYLIGRITDYVSILGQCETQLYILKHYVEHPRKSELSKEVLVQSTKELLEQIYYTFANLDVPKKDSNKKKTVF